MNSKMPFYWIPGDRWPDVDSEEAHLGELYRDVMTIDPEILIGHIFDFYGAHSNQFKIDDLVLEALEDPEDGYRSLFHSLVIPPKKEKFFHMPLARVKFTELSIDDDDGRSNRSKGWSLQDTNEQHTWLEIGTDYSDDYYPCFFFRYNPKSPKGEI